MKLKPTAFFQMAIAVLMVAVLFHSAGFRYPRAKALPMVVAAIVLGLVIIDLWRTIRQSQADRVSHDTGGDEGSPKRTNRQYLIEGLWLAGFCIGVYVLGFLISMPLFVFSYLHEVHPSFSLLVLFLLNHHQIFFHYQVHPYLFSFII